ncbi:MAG TPA: Ig-like domain-containing protein [Candidatus Hydrogenedentes bacterium]|nr:Ig-like domain-containing protein [Candidatus Hydrogenedentota bacterium]
MCAKRVVRRILVVMSFCLAFVGCPSQEYAVVTVTPGHVELEIEETVHLTAVSTDGEDLTFTWAPSAGGIATVDDAGNVTGVAAGTATITATGTHSLSSGSATVTVLPAGDGDGEGNGLVFIHHSVGENWLAHSLESALLAKTYIDDRNDITYGTVIAPDTGRPASLGEVPGDLTDMQHWVLWFNDYLEHVKIEGCQDGVNRIIMFKSCFPNSHIDDAGEEPGNPFDGWRTLANYRAVFRHPDGPGNTYEYEGHVYRPLEDVFAENPDTLFIPVTAPPECWADTDAAIAARAREFNNWLKDEWLPNYETETGLQNVAVFDLFDVVANEEHAASHPNQLREEYGGDSGDSHPNDDANARLTEVFATDPDNFLDTEWAEFSAKDIYALLSGEDTAAGPVAHP